MQKNLDRARKKLKQLTEELSRDKIDWHSVAHLSRDLCAVATSEESYGKHNKKMG